jgi:hypothetical protein
MRPRVKRSGRLGLWCISYADACSQRQQFFVSSRFYVVACLRFGQKKDNQTVFFFYAKLLSLFMISCMRVRWASSVPLLPRPDAAPAFVSSLERTVISCLCVCAKLHTDHRRPIVPGQSECSFCCWSVGTVLRAHQPVQVHSGH